MLDLKCSNILRNRYQDILHLLMSPLLFPSINIWFIYHSNFQYFNLILNIKETSGVKFMFNNLTQVLIFDLSHPTMYTQIVITPKEIIVNCHFQR